MGSVIQVDNRCKQSMGTSEPLDSLSSVSLVLTLVKIRKLCN